MKKLIILVYIFLFASAVYGANNIRQEWLNANAMYTTSQFQKALDSYLKLADEGYNSKALFYNTANCYFKLKDYGHAILYYEKALKFDPSDKDVIGNLELAKDYTVDKIDVVPEFILRTWMKNINYSLSANGWTYIGLTFLAFTLFLLLWFRFTVSQARRKIIFAGMILGTLIVIFSFGFSWSQVSDYNKKDSAIIMKAVSVAKSSPDESGKTLFILHQGTKVEITDQISRWKRVVLSDGRNGWISEDDMEII